MSIDRESDWNISFEACSTSITAARDIFKQIQILMDGFSVKYFILKKNVTFWNEGTFTLASSEQKVQVILKLTDLQSLG